jgi:Protein of unknown function (DUF732)
MIAAGAAGLVAAGIVSAGPATADQAQDDQYFAALQQIYPGRSLRPGPNIENAHKVCDRLGRGDKFDAVVNDLHGTYPQHSLEQVQQEVHLAQSTYCP